MTAVREIDPSGKDALAPLVRALGRGPGRARHLTRSEAATAMAAMLDGSAAREAVGALLMLLRYRGENAEEIAGFVDGLRARLDPGWRAAASAIDWPTYAAGRSRGAPWFLLSARLVASAGFPVLLHGWQSAANPVSALEPMLETLAIPVVTRPDEARAALSTVGVAYAPLAALDPAALDLLRLRDVLGLRSPVNTALRALNPAGAETSVQGVFHPSYRGLQQDAAMALGQARLLVLKGGGGEFERHPGKEVALMGVRAGTAFEIAAPPMLDAKARLADAATADPSALWRGEAADPFAEAAVIGTAAAALFAAGAAADLDAAAGVAGDLWRGRHSSKAA